MITAMGMTVVISLVLSGVGMEKSFMSLGKKLQPPLRLKSPIRTSEPVEVHCWTVLGFQLAVGRMRRAAALGENVLAALWDEATPVVHSLASLA